MNGKEYVVKQCPDGSFDIAVVYETLVPSTVYSAHPQVIVMSRYISQHGRLGKKLIREFRRNKPE